ncbi:hypothetical protein M513_08642 [Trichuris suis]|uniref:Uncharacterized protein n=1 Tax=Trichuris suis TaxID=68888 RepID=A0A085LZL9_9BILA|nr:hypothetical protein M513_08642 [Trichuris suis]
MEGGRFMMTGLACGEILLTRCFKLPAKWTAWLLQWVRLTGMERKQGWILTWLMLPLSTTIKKFEVTLGVKQFNPQELEVNTTDNAMVIHGK